MNVILPSAAWSLLQTDPLPYGPSTWGVRQWIGIALYAVLFVLFVYLVYRLARPSLPSEVDLGVPPDEGDEDPASPKA